MNLMEILREYHGIDEKIEVEKLSIQMGKDYVQELGSSFDGGGLDVWHSGLSSEEKALPKMAEQVKEEMQENGWRHLMEYRRLMQTKITCMRAMQALSDDDKRLLQERAISGKSWRQLHASFGYCESQLRRRFAKSFAQFSHAYREQMAGNDREKA